MPSVRRSGGPASVVRLAAWRQAFAAIERVDRRGRSVGRSSRPTSSGVRRSKRGGGEFRSAGGVLGMGGFSRAASLSLPNSTAGAAEGAFVSGHGRQRGQDVGGSAGRRQSGRVLSHSSLSVSTSRRQESLAGVTNVRGRLEFFLDY